MNKIEKERKLFIFCFLEILNAPVDSKTRIGKTDRQKDR
jgi:hypothetical protein